MSNQKETEDKVTQVYLKSAEHSWIPAIQMKVHKNIVKVVVPKYKQEQDMMSCARLTRQQYYDTRDVNLGEYPNSVLPMQNVDANGNLEDYKDMVELPFLHEAAILYNLKLRHQREKPYTRTGDILIAVNPYQWFNELYTEQKQAYYSNRLVWDNPTEDPRSTIEPHVYEVSALSYKGLINGGGDQSILVSGESGAGKTETVKICLNHIASVQRGAGYYGSNDLDPIVQRVVESNPLLEAFGNAKTRRNDNSSRFGKYLQLQFDNVRDSHSIAKASRCALIGSKCDVYLLEKNRVVKHEPEERNFHIFYQLLAAPDHVKSRFWKGLQGATTESFSYVGKSKTTSIEGVSDCDKFSQTLEALALVGVKGSTLDMLMHAICVVLQLGNLGFCSRNGDSDKSMVSTQNELSALSELMGISEKDLALSFTERTFTTINETHKVPLKPDMAKDAADALAKEIYQKAFLWLTETINVATSVDSSGKKLGIVGLLDIFGFETFEINRYEQLCINYANEKLQQKFTQDIFTSVQAEYEAEGIALVDIWYDDNTDVLDLIEGPTGLLALLNEECVRPKGNDFEYVQKVLSINKNSPCLLVHRTDRISFGIKHYAGQVMYDAVMFVSKNIDTLPTDLQACSEKCTNAIINTPRREVRTVKNSSFYGGPVKNNSFYGGGPRGQSNITAATVWTKYRNQLESLMISLRQTNSRYIRCIKPNTQKMGLVMEHNLVVEQLRCAGVVAGITITRSVFPNRLPNSLVLARFSNMGQTRRSQKQASVEKQRVMDCKILLDNILRSLEKVDEDGHIIKAFVVGKTKTYFRAGALEFLDSHRVRGLDLQASIIQKAARGWLVRSMGRHERQRRRLAELEKERARQEELARKSRLEQEAKERREKRQQSMLKYQNEVNKLEQQLNNLEVQKQQRLREATERADAARNEKAQLEMDIERYEKEVRGKRLAAKAYVETKLEACRHMIDHLRRENKKLEQFKAKYDRRYDDVTGNSERLNESFNVLEETIVVVEADAKKVDSKYKSLSNILDQEKARNKKLKSEVEEAQSRYMGQAEHRLELQKTLARVMHIIQERLDSANINEEIVVAAMHAEGTVRAIMASVEAETAEPDLALTSDDSWTENSSNSIDMN